MKRVPYSPISLSDLLSISVSVSVSAELERLERHEFCPDFAPVPQRVMVRSGDTGSWFSVATGPLEQLLSGWERPVSGQSAKPLRAGGSQIPSCLSENVCPVNDKSCKVNKPSNNAVNGQEQDYFKKHLTHVLGEREGVVKLKPLQHPPKPLNSHQLIKMPRRIFLNSNHRAALW